MATSSKKLWARGAIGVALLIAANVLVAVQHNGTHAGQTFRWIGHESGAELTYNPSQFGSTRLSPGHGDSSRETKWEMVEPQSPSPLLPWNWLAVALDPPAPDPGAIIRQQIPAPG
jgi:hypothetical protein